jgi:hypothetical protein
MHEHVFVSANVASATNERPGNRRFGAFYDR